MLDMNQNTKVMSCLDEAQAFIQEAWGTRPVLGIVCGSGLSAMGDLVENAVSIDYGKIPHMPQPKVAGHAGKLVLGELHGTPVAVLCGRVHVYEGWPLWQVVFGVRLLARLGVDSVLLSNAAGSLNKSIGPGSLCIIEDHINLMGVNPLLGPNIDELGPRFPDMSTVYDKELAVLMDRAASLESAELERGIYAAMLGPSYETPAEVRYLGIIGATLVGMSTVPEATALRHLGVKVIGISVVSNLASGVSSQPLDHSEVKEIANAVGPVLTRVVRRFAGLLSDDA
jgi:purine-nucleoside phosphorylase